MSKDKKVGEKKSAHSNPVTGKLDISRSGMGYVIVEGMDRDIVVRPNDFNQAFHGDIVKVQVNKQAGKGRRTEGRITQVEERMRTNFIGNLEINRNTAFFVAATDKPMPDFYIPTEKLNGAVNGDRVVVRLLK